jgi:phosphatidylethanolamine/phosphatidyl-N-methylethanolamine N-methyltransferase
MSKETTSFYNRFTPLYPLVDAFLRPQKKVLFREINQQRCGDLLEIGVGNGAHLPLYKNHKIIGIDTSSAMLDVARKQKPGNIELLQMDGHALSFQDEQFHYVVLSHVIAVVDDPERLLAEVLRVLKPKGKVFILNHFTPDNWLRHIDGAFRFISKTFCFKSVFHLHEIAMLKNFTLLEEVRFGSLGYFKLLIFQKK